jgi:hypothetical protein
MGGGALWCLSLAPANRDRGQVASSAGERALRMQTPVVGRREPLIPYTLSS